MQWQTTLVNVKGQAVALKLYDGRIQRMHGGYLSQVYYKCDERGSQRK